MSAHNFEHIHLSQQQVDINPFVLFFVIMIIPYMLFFGFLMFLTGQLDLTLLFTSVIQVNNTVYFKTWLIGSFLLTCCSALLFSGYRARLYLLARWIQNRTKSRNENISKPSHFYSIEELTNTSEETPERHRELEHILSLNASK